MPLGTINIDYAEYNRWKPDKIEKLEHFLSQGTQCTVRVVQQLHRPDILQYTLNHPDFLSDIENAQYVLSWRLKRDLQSGSNFYDVITALLVKGANYKFEIVKKYD
jgi:hypothetical protein